jgi:hypothetical protein
MKQTLIDWLIALFIALLYSWFAAEGLDAQLVIEATPQPYVITAN